MHQNTLQFLLFRLQHSVQVLLECRVHVEHSSFSFVSRPRPLYYTQSSPLTLELFASESLNASIGVLYKLREEPYYQ